MAGSEETADSTELDDVENAVASSTEDDVVEDADSEKEDHQENSDGGDTTDDSTAEDPSDNGNSSQGSTQADNTEPSSSRRAFLYGAVGGGVGLAIGATAGAALSRNNQDQPDSTTETVMSTGNAEIDITTDAGQAYTLRIDSARQHYDETFKLDVQPTNGDEDRYSSENFYASFTKTLPSNEFGEVDPDAFNLFTKALSTGESDDFDAIVLAPNAEAKLANPQAAFSSVLTGKGGETTRINPSHTFRSPQLAAEMSEVYWQALLRDTPYADYEADADVEAAVTDLNAMEATPGLVETQALDASLLFRGETKGDRIGPYISQFLFPDFNFGPLRVSQRYPSPLPGVDYLADVESWLAIQQGAAPASQILDDSTQRYIFNNRTLGEYVHRDVTCQAYIHAAFILLQRGPEMVDPSNPYVGAANQGGFVTFGPPFMLDLVMRAAKLALSGAWYQKWRVHRLLRPEAYSGRVHFTLSGDRDYEVHNDVLDSEAVSRLLTTNETALLPVAYPEGSPTHPSFPAGHANIAGACVTVLKALFDEDAVFPEPVVATRNGLELVAYSETDLTVGNELNKLASNISLGRDAAGVHYRQDGIQGLEAGEQQAISLLQDISRTTSEAGFDGFSFTRFDGSAIRIKDGLIKT